MTRRINPLVAYLIYIRLFETVKSMNYWRAESKMHTSRNSQQIAWSADEDFFLFVAFDNTSMHGSDDEVVNIRSKQRK